MKVVVYKSTQKLSCACPTCSTSTVPETTEVIVCIDASLTSLNLPFISATLTATILSGVCNNQQVYSYYLSYDEAQLLDPSTGLTNAQINGVICRGCMTTWVEALFSGSTCYSCEDLPVCVRPEIYPECFGAIGDGVHDDGPAINSAIAVAVAAGEGKIKFSTGKTYLTTVTIDIPITAQYLTLSGYGASILGNVDGYILQISDDTTQNGRAEKIVVEGLRIYGLGPTDLTYPNQSGIFIGAILGCVLRSVSVLNVPNYALVGTKSQQSGSQYWEQVFLDNFSARFIGLQGLRIGTLDAVDDLEMFGGILNHCGERINSASPNGSSFINAIALSMVGVEISANYSNTNVGFGYLWGLHIRHAGGVLSGIHFELNGADQAGSSDLLLDTDANGLMVIGSDHYGAAAQGAKFCIQTSSKNNTIQGLTWAGTVVHNYDYIVEANNATNCQIGAIAAIGTSTSPNVAVVNYGSYGKVTFDNHDGYISTARRNENRQTKYAAVNPAQIVLGAGWGATATVTSVQAYDSNGFFIITAQGGGYVAPADVTITFTDGLWTAAPTCILVAASASNTLLPITYTCNATRIFMTANVAPSDGVTYSFYYMLVGT